MAPSPEIRESVTRKRSRRLFRTAVASLAAAGLVLTTGLLTSTESAEAAPGRERYVVKTESATSNAKAVVKAERTGARVERPFSKVMHGFTATLTAAEAKQLSETPGVEAVVPDVAYSIDSKTRTETVQTGPPWGLDRIDNQQQPAPDQPALDGTYDYTNTGAGETVFVIDTGVNLTHTQFGGRALSGYDFVSNDSNASDCDGHGTHVAGTIGGSTYGVAKGVRIVAVRVLDCEGSGYVSDLLAGLDWVYTHRPPGPAAVNMSVGFPVANNTMLAGWVDDAINDLAAARIPVVVAAGNQGSDACNYGPARSPKAITVGADTIFGADLPNGDQGPLLPYDTRASFSNTGSCIDLYAPGTWIESAYVGSSTAWAILDGTSMATPHVTGAIARLQQDSPLASVATLTDELLTQTTNGALNNAGGAPNKLLYLVPGAQLAGAPTNQSVSVNDRLKTATVNWEPPATDGGSPIGAYRVIRIGSYDGRRQAIAVANLSSTARSYTFGSLIAGGTYSIRIVPITVKGTGQASAQVARLMALPGKPRIGKASSGTKSKGITVTARWDKPTSVGPIRYYQVKADRLSSSKNKTVTVSGSARSVKITGLAKKKKYRIYVRGLNDAGVGVWSSASNKVTAK